MPRRGGNTGGNTGNTKNSKNAPAQQVLPNFRGKLRKMDSKSISIELDDYRVMEFRATGKTKYLKNGEEVKNPQFNPGDQISVEGTEEGDGSMTAVNVYWEKAASTTTTSGKKDDATADTWKDAPKDAPQSASERTPPPAPRAADDPGPPVLKRGKPTEQTTAAASAPPLPEPAGAAVPLPNVNLPPGPQQTAANLPPRDVELPRTPPSDRGEDQSPLGSHEQDPLILKATEAALEFTETLPNYVCQEMMSRFESESKPANWHAVDVVSMEVVYENGRENYRNIAINGKATNKSVEDLPGARSTGEFGTVLIDLFSPATDADFRPHGTSRIAGITAKVYGFEVKRENSHWSLHFGSQSYEPAFGGSVWIDPQTGRVLRIEMEARALPKDFPEDHVESATDYQYVRLGDSQQYLLPVHAETLSCQRNTPYCSRNTIDFRNYHKYTGESNIQFGDVKK